MNAYHLPEGVNGAGLYPSISPVNSFWVIFNRYFGQDLELLPDRSYFMTVGHPYQLILVEAP